MTLFQGHLSGWQDFWSPRWPCKMISRSPTWPWINKKPSRLQFHVSRKRIKLSIIQRVEEFIQQKVRGIRRVFQNHIFEVPKIDSIKSWLVLDISRLKKFIVNYPTSVWQLPPIFSWPFLRSIYGFNIHEGCLLAYSNTS